MYIFPVWLPPFCAAVILIASGVTAIRIARSVMPKWLVGLTAGAGFAAALFFTLFIIQQPWALIKHLPNARGANLSGMDLSHIYLDGGSGVTFEEANLSYANLSYACLVNCRFNLHKANLTKANLQHAFLEVANITDAVLKDVNLNDAEIYGVDFTGSDFRGASLGFHARGRIVMENTNLCGVDLRRIKDFSGIYVWTGAIYDSKTLWPEGFNPTEAGAVLCVGKNTKGSP
jgi:hypothetical protein